MKETMYIFVYGTLMVGFRNYDKYLKNKVISSQIAFVKGSLFHLANKDYPAFIDEGDDKIYGEILEIPKDYSLMDEIDNLEGCKDTDCKNHEYCKKQITVFKENGEIFADLPVYVYNIKSKMNVDDERLIVNSGDWKKYKRK